MTNQINPQSLDSLASGRSPTDPFITQFSTRDPNSNDIQYPVQKRWFNTSLNKEWILVGFTSFSGILQADWHLISQTMVSAETLTGNSGGAVSVDGMNNINVVGDTTTINIVGNPGTHTLTASTTGSIATLYTEDSGTATPSGGNLIVTGSSTGLTTTGSGNTVGFTGVLNIAHGGTNASSMATTDGTIYFDGTRLVTTATGTSGQVLTSNGAGVAPQYKNPAVVLIASQIISNNPSIIFTNIGFGLGGFYLLRINNYQPVAANSDLFINVSTDNGVTFQNSGYISGLNYSAYNSATLTNVNSTTGIYIGTILANAGSYSVDVWIENQLSAYFQTHGTGMALLNNNFMYFGGSWGGLNANAFRVIASTGNLSGGDIALYKFLTS